MNNPILFKARTVWQKLNAPIDRPLMVLTFALLAYATFIIGSASPQRISAHFANLAVGLSCLFVAAHITPQRLRNMTPSIYIAGVILLLAVALFGDISKGAQRWLNIGFTRIQPSEILKIAAPLMLAWFYFHRDEGLRHRDHLVAVCLLMLPVLLIAKQPDLGTGILVFLSGFFVLFLAGIPWKWISPLVIATIGIIGVLLVFGDTLCQRDQVWPLLRDYQKHRVCTMLNPTSDPLGKGFHIIQAMIAIGSGGLWGKGWGLGSQTQLDFLPERHTDFIFAVLAEELGLLGTLTLLVIYIALVLRGLSIALHTKDRFGRYVAGSLTLSIFSYAFVNMGMVTGMLPVVGVPLPFMSYGGTALVILCISLGILMSIAHSRTTAREG